jgi:hypothetical protein
MYESNTQGIPLSAVTDSYNTDPKPDSNTSYPALSGIASGEFCQELKVLELNSELYKVAKERDWWKSWCIVCMAVLVLLTLIHFVRG